MRYSKGSWVKLGIFKGFELDPCEIFYLKICITLKNISITQKRLKKFDRHFLLIFLDLCDNSFFKHFFKILCDIYRCKVYWRSKTLKRGYETQQIALITLRNDFKKGRSRAKNAKSTVAFEHTRLKIPV